MRRMVFQNGSIFQTKWISGNRVVGGRRTPEKRAHARPYRAVDEGRGTRELAAILAPLNGRESPPSKAWALADFFSNVFLPFYRRKWKRSTAMTNEDRMHYHLVSEFGSCILGSFHSGAAAVDFLDRKAASGPFVQLEGGSSSVGI